MRTQTGIQPFNEREADNLSSHKGFVFGKDMTFGEFIEYSIENKDKTARFYFGKLSKEFADRIEAATGKNVENYIVAINSTEIRHILNEHGDSVSKSTLQQLPNVFNNPDEIMKSPVLDSAMRIAFAIKKKINGYSIVVNGISEGRMTIQIDTLWTINRNASLIQIIESTKKRRSTTFNV